MIVVKKNDNKVNRQCIERNVVLYFYILIISKVLFI